MCLTVCALCTHSFLPPFERLKGGSQYDAGGVSIMSIVNIVGVFSLVKFIQKQINIRLLPKSSILGSVLGNLGT